MRANIAKDDNAVTLIYDHPVDATFRINRRFIAARGEVLQDRGSRGWEKICFGLSSNGDVLTCHDNSQLLPIIRRLQAVRQIPGRSVSLPLPWKQKSTVTLRRLHDENYEGREGIQLYVQIRYIPWQRDCFSPRPNRRGTALS